MLATLIAEGNTCLTFPPVNPDKDAEDLKLALAIVQAMLEVMPAKEVRDFLNRIGA